MRICTLSSPVPSDFPLSQVTAEQSTTGIKRSAAIASDSDDDLILPKQTRVRAAFIIDGTAIQQTYQHDTLPH